jgi:hypothetical protein
MPMRVELLYWDADPDYMTARQRLVEVLTEDAFETTIQMVAVNSEADARFLDFRGSPTIRIDGHDIAGQEDAAIGLSLRRPIPSGTVIRSAVDRARGWSHGRR